MTKISHDSETPAQGQQVFTAVAFIHHEFDGVQKIFLPQRAATKQFMPSVYELPGGHVDYGEDMKTGLKREVLEELGIEITLGDPFFVFDYSNEIKGSHSIEVVYFATLISELAAIVLHPEDHSDAGWFGEDDIATVENIGRQADDPEILAIKKGFRILRGEPLDFA